MSTEPNQACACSQVPVARIQKAATVTNTADGAKGMRSGPEEKRLQGHWLLAKMGKRVLRPGGMEMTKRILAKAAPNSDDTIVEFGPGVGKTAEILLEAQPSRYWGVDVRNEGDNPLVDVLAGHEQALLVNADAKKTGLDEHCATLVVGEAMLTMQSDADKVAIMREAFRILAPGGRYALHEMGFKPEATEKTTGAVEKNLSQTIKVGARPLTLDGWRKLLGEAGFDVVYSTTNKMALLEVRRVIADEGWGGFLRFVFNVARNPAARKRIAAMRKTFKTNQQFICAVGFVAVKPE